MKVLLGVLRLAGQEFAQRDAHKIRGYIGRQWEEFDLLHNHKDGRVLYKYPLVQYKVLRGVPYVIGLAEGVPMVQKIFLELRELKINDQSYDNFQMELSYDEAEFGDAGEPVTYQFVTPWLALNQQNYQKFRSFGIDLDKHATVQHEIQLDMLQSILVNNVIAVAKALRYTIGQRHHPIISVETCEVKFKDQPMLAFKGSFQMNFHLPDFIGLGKSPARGFGTVKKLLP
ncbi:MAG: CRISPR-associated endonuclease Cas6 [candidate division KSB1 bacterium]|nr:CRISPR-associated endonuclease Cas6 [candidate division KSB1 bacterium]MDZ7274608.1 CRISPR-associated endonuclease Cas6 [candidate division KSB1 bacterium]MDZ7285433.1 CRISPR-associated endonuclease Cas6 [candidate division KSB1 bacterium]MDZ7298465.1 CRISPR-associated endonuclease Cas6 [candidate division KSB1 bacterium]MDZ7306949.1 CRISPR-associated endonuclease Cas6 [candidate division KSB1 bacterium]